MLFSKIVKNFKDDNGYTLNQCADVLGVSANTVRLIIECQYEIPTDKMIDTVYAGLGYEMPQDLMHDLSFESDGFQQKRYDGFKNPRERLFNYRDYEITNAKSSIINMLEKNNQKYEVGGLGDAFIFTSTAEKYKVFNHLSRFSNTSFLNRLVFETWNYSTYVPQLKSFTDEELKNLYCALHLVFFKYDEYIMALNFIDQHNRVFHLSYNCSPVNVFYSFIDIRSGDFEEKPIKFF